MKQTFYSNGKLLLTGEYVVLDGAVALALPTKFGQNLIVEQAGNQIIQWKSYNHDGTIWFQDSINFESIIKKEITDGDTSIRNTLVEILHEAYRLNPLFLEQSNGYSITTTLTFPKDWGLGTSSTLINNLAQWLKIDGFTLLQNSFGGSGYDIACAQHNSAILYQLQDNSPIVEPVSFNPTFKNNLYFVYLNQKQNSRSAIASYRKKTGNTNQYIAKISKITKQIVVSSNLTTFSKLLMDHEIEMSSILEMQTIQEVFFDDFNGTIKSLGAWGGDFVLAISEKDPTLYFQEKGFKTVIPYEKMIL